MRIQLTTTLLVTFLALSGCAPGSTAPVAHNAGQTTEVDAQETMTEAPVATAGETLTADAGMAVQESDGEMTADSTAAMADASKEEMDAMTDGPVPDPLAGETGEMAESHVAQVEQTETMAVADVPAWQQISLTDAHTGDAFTLADFAGQTVFVEPFATWCTNCRQQLENVAQARTQLGDEVVFVALSVEPNIAATALSDYANAAGFDWRFAAITPEMLQLLADEFGQTIANPPATPHFLIRPDGSTSDLQTGVKSADTLVVLIQMEQGG